MTFHFGQWEITIAAQTIEEAEFKKETQNAWDKASEKKLNRLEEERAAIEKERDNLLIENRKSKIENQQTALLSSLPPLDDDELVAAFAVHAEHPLWRGVLEVIRLAKKAAQGSAWTYISDGNRTFGFVGAIECLDGLKAELVTRRTQALNDRGGALRRVKLRRRVREVASEEDGET